MKYLGVDFGLKRIGLALSEGILADPYKIIEIKNLADGVSKIKKEVEDNQIDKIVIGMSEGETGRKIEQFVKLLKDLGLDVVEADETLTTIAAMESVIRSGVPQARRRFVDAQAAAIILQNYLDDR